MIDWLALGMSLVVLGVVIFIFISDALWYRRENKERNERIDASIERMKATQAHYDALNADIENSCRKPRSL